MRGAEDAPAAFARAAAHQVEPQAAVLAFRRHLRLEKHPEGAHSLARVRSDYFFRLSRRSVQITMVSQLP